MCVGSVGDFRGKNAEIASQARAPCQSMVGLKTKLARGPCIAVAYRVSKVGKREDVVKTKLENAFHGAGTPRGKIAKKSNCERPPSKLAMVRAIALLRWSTTIF